MMPDRTDVITNQFALTQLKIDPTRGFVQNTIKLTTILDYQIVTELMQTWTVSISTRVTLKASTGERNLVRLSM